MPYFSPGSPALEQPLPDHRRPSPPPISSDGGCNTSDTKFPWQDIFTAVERLSVPISLSPSLLPAWQQPLHPSGLSTPSLGVFVGTPELGWGLGSPTCIDLGAAQSIPRGYFCSTKPITLLPRYATVLQWHEQTQPDAVGSTGWEITSPSLTAPSPPWRSLFLFPCCNYF